jgi:hypothetical protein
MIVILSEGTEKKICLHHNGKTQFVLLHESSKGWDETYIQLDYDVDALLKDIKESVLEQEAPMWTYLLNTI